MAREYTIDNGSVRVVAKIHGVETQERIELMLDGDWQPALFANGSASRITYLWQRRETFATAELVEASVEESGGGQVLRTRAVSPLGEVLRAWRFHPDGTLGVEVTFTPHTDLLYRGIEDRWTFAPKRRSADVPTQGPLDFVWSQNIKRQAENVLPHWTFKSPAVMFQQGRLFAALLPRLDGLTRPALERFPVSLDLDVTAGERAWMAYGIIPAKPALNNYGGQENHSYFVRAFEVLDFRKHQPVSFAYRFLVSDEAPRLGYRKVVRNLWERTGSKALAASPDLQQNVQDKSLYLFNDWRSDTWERFAPESYMAFDYEGTPCGLLTSRRYGERGSRTNTEWDGWYQFWCQSLHTAYGWYQYAERQGNADLKEKAESIFRLALQAPQIGGAFPVVYFHERDGSHTWCKDDPWAGFRDEYHTLHMSWTGYWLLRWVKDLLPDQRGVVQRRLCAYGDFLLAHQLESGCVPSWYDDHLRPARAEFRTFNAETAVSALFLAELFQLTGEGRYCTAAEQMMAFIEREVLPRQRWADFETYISCSPKPFDFYDGFTTQYPQNNVSTLAAAWAYLLLANITGRSGYLSLGEQVLDYLLLTQQVWNHPMLEPKLVGGFTTQNTDAEWSDARQGYIAELLLDYYNATGRMEYLERAVAAAQSGFAVAPYENWAHHGYSGYHFMSGIHWGTGTVMTAVEILSAQLGDAYIDVGSGSGVGLNACTVRRVAVQENAIEIDIDLAAVWQEECCLMRFEGVDDAVRYNVKVNGAPRGSLAGSELRAAGLRLRRQAGEPGIV
jgi:hypothetical protein